MKAGLLPPPEPNPQLNNRPMTPPNLQLSQTTLSTPITPIRPFNVSITSPTSPLGARRVSAGMNATQSQALSPEAKRRRRAQIEAALAETPLQGAIEAQTQIKDEPITFGLMLAPPSLIKDEDEDEDMARLGSPSKRARVADDEEEDRDSNFHSADQMLTEDEDEDERSHLPTPSPSRPSQRGSNPDRPPVWKGKAGAIANNDPEEDLKRLLLRLKQGAAGLRDAASISLRAARDMTSRADELQGLIEEIQQKMAEPDGDTLSISQKKALLVTIEECV